MVRVLIEKYYFFSLLLWNHVSSLDRRKINEIKKLKSFLLSVSELKQKKYFWDCTELYNTQL